jgi:hypothetical protein
VQHPEKINIEKNPGTGPTVFIHMFLCFFLSSLVILSAN